MKPDYDRALARAILVYDVKYEQVQRSGHAVDEQKLRQAWDAIVELAKANEEERKKQHGTRSRQK